MVPVLNENKEPLMPTTWKRAKKLMSKGEAKPYWNKGIFCIILQRPPKTTYKQEVCIGIDPGSKMSGMTVKSEAHTILNIQYASPVHVRSRMEARKEERASRRKRKTPYRKRRSHRKLGEWTPPSVKSRWIQHLNLIKWFSKLVPVTYVAVEDIKAKTIKNARQWNVNFSPIEYGKNWFYKEVEKDYKLYLFEGYDTYVIRQNLGLVKGKDKLKVSFESHCVDSWTIANQVVGGHIEPDNTKITYLKPLVYKRRKLHELVPKKGGYRKNAGTTLSLGLKRGSLVKHPKYGLTILGGTSKGRVSIHCTKTYKRLSQIIKKEDLKVFTVLRYCIE